MLRSTLTGIAFTLAALGTTAHAAEPIGPKFPTGYRGWAHVKSMVIHSDKSPLFAAFSGIHHVYANQSGVQGTKANGKFDDGAVLVFDLLQNDDVDGVYVEGTRKLVAVMQKDSKKYKDTGGWGFQAFKGGNASEPVVTDPKSQCLSCHQAQKDTDFVFSKFRE